MKKLFKVRKKTQAFHKKVEKARCSHSPHPIPSPARGGEMRTTLLLIVHYFKWTQFFLSFFKFRK